MMAFDSMLKHTMLGTPCTYCSSEYIIGTLIARALRSLFLRE